MHPHAPSLPKNAQRSLSVIIPAYNESQRILGTLIKTAGFLQQQNYLWEIIVVDDGSLDNTGELVELFARREQLADCIRLVRLPQNTGKGAATKEGILSSRQAHCLICDADLAVPIEDIQRLWRAIDAHENALAIGSRNLPQSETIIQLKWYRLIIGRVFNALLARLTPGIYDTQCGFKLLPAPRAKSLATSQVEVGFAFDVEYLHLALRSEWKVCEVSVNWNHVEGSKVRIFRDSARMFASIIRIWFRSKIGAYGNFPLQTDESKTV